MAEYTLIHLFCSHALETMEQFRHNTDRRSVTLQEVARAAGVSSSAASVILNGAKSGTRVSVTTQRAVLEVAARMGYRPHPLAQSLATGRSGRIGVYSGQARLDSRNAFFAEILGGVFDGAEQFQLDTVVHTSGNDEARLVNLLRGQSLDGLIVHPHPDDKILPLLGELMVPAVSIADATEGVPSVAVDDVEGGNLLARHLASLGHRHVLVKRSLPPRSSAIRRIAAFSETCSQLGIRVTMGVELSDIGAGLDASDLRVLTQSSDRATAVMAWSDAVAESVCQSLEAFGLEVPGDVAVVGFDGFRSRNASRFELTTVQAPWSAVGRQAVRHLDTLVRGEPVPMLTTLPVIFHHGNTT